MNVFKTWKISQKPKNLPKGEFFGAYLTHVKISLQPKFQGSSLKNKQDIGSVENVFKIWKISRKLKNLPKGEFFGALIIKQQV